MRYCIYDFEKQVSSNLQVILKKSRRVPEITFFTKNVPYVTIFIQEALPIVLNDDTWLEDKFYSEVAYLCILLHLYVLYSARNAVLASFRGIARAYLPE